MVDRKVRAIMIIEVAGRPPEYLKNSLEIHVNKINNVKGAKLIQSKMAEPHLIDEKNEVYTIFSEVEVETDDLTKLMDLVFEFMPSSIEIIEPVDIVMDCQQATMFMNDLAGRLHKYDEIAKIARLQNQQLALKLQEIQKQNPTVQAVENKEKSSPEKKSKKKSSKSKKK